MPRTRSIAAHVPVKSVDFIEYYYSSETDELNVTTHYVTLKLNKHIYVGRYAANSEANALAHAEDVVKGCLTKCGCRNPNTRLAGVPFKKYGFPPPIPLTDVIPDAFDLGNLSYMDKAEAPNNVVQITGIDTNINLRLSLVSGGGGTVYYRTSSSSFATNDYVFNSGLWNVLSFTGANSANINIAPNQYIGFVVVPSANDDTLTYQVQNVSDSNSVLDTFTALKNTQTADVTPTLSFMLDLSYNDGAPVVNNYGNIRSISTPVSFRLVKTGGGSASVYYRSGGIFDQTDYATNPGSWTTLSFTNNISGTIPITANNYVGFAVVPATTGDTITFEVRNVSDNNTLMQSFTALKNSTADVTPNAVNWSDIAYNDAFGEPGWTSKQITGISAPITLFASTTYPADQNLYWKVTATEPLYDSFLTGFSQSTTTFSVSDTQWVTFAYVGSSTATVTVYNQSDSNAVLDTFTVDVAGVP